MKRKNPTFKKIVFMGLLISLGFGLPGCNRTQKTKRIPLTELKFSAPIADNPSADTIQAAATADCDALFAFMETRSGLKLDEPTRRTIRIAQAKALANRTGSDPDQFADEFNLALIQRIRAAPEPVFDAYMEKLMAARLSVMIVFAFNGEKAQATPLSGRELAVTARFIRNGTSDPKATNYFESGSMREIVRAMFDICRKSSPSLSASTRDGKYLPPAQRLLLAYLILSGDAGHISPKNGERLFGENGRLVDIPFDFYFTGDVVEKITREK